LYAEVFFFADFILALKSNVKEQFTSKKIISHQCWVAFEPLKPRDRLITQQKNKESTTKLFKCHLPATKLFQTKISASLVAK
jgi:hypothetical protein